MLTHLLPGLREVRGPLAAGYLWLVIAWLALEYGLPPRAEASEVLQSFQQLVESGTVLGTGVILSFIAYLIGVFSQGLWRRPLMFAARLLGRQAIVHMSESRRLEHPAPDNVATPEPDGRKLSAAAASRTSDFHDKILQNAREYVLERAIAPTSITSESVSTRPQYPSDTVETVWEIKVAVRVRNEGRVSRPGVKSLYSLLQDRDRARASRDRSRLGVVPEVREFLRERRALVPSRLALLRTWWIAKRDPRDPRHDFLTLGDVLERDDMSLESPYDDDEGFLDIDAKREILLRTIEELNLVETRLIGDHADLYATVDRIRAESDFRLTIVPPLLALLIVLSLHSYFLLLGLLGVVMFLKQAIAREEQAGELLVDALVLHRVEAPIFEKLGLTVARQRHRGETQEQHDGNAVASGARSTPAP